jgi:hypothetical protein
MKTIWASPPDPGSSPKIELCSWLWFLALVPGSSS